MVLCCLTDHCPALQAVAKAIHVPVRRREEAATAPTMAMRAAAVNLAVVLRRNFDFQVGAAHTGVGAA